MRNTDLNKTARIAGFLYLILAPIGFFGIMYIPSSLFIAGDITSTANNIVSNELMFRLGIASALLTQVIQLILVLYLYQLLKSVSKKHAKLMVILVLVGVPIAILNELCNFAVLHLLGSADYSLSLISLFLDLHQDGIIIAQIFWGLWLLPLGYLVYKSGYLPKVLGILLIIGGFGYVIDSTTLIVFPDFGITLSEFTFLGELLFPLWLVIKGVKKS